MTKRIKKHVKSRNAKTAPSTPEVETRGLPRHAESTSHLEMCPPSRQPPHKPPPNGRSSDRSSNRSSTINGSDVPYSPKSPDKEPPKKRKKTRNEKFHKLFKAIPLEETVLKCYSCAFFGDILLQGYLYISPNYFCFYSKILGHAKQIQISVAEVLNISREKTAIIIPNAIGILTPQDKYVFGSLMSRDNTFKFLWSVWKQTTAQEGDEIDIADISDLNPDGDSTGDPANNNNVLKPSIDVTSANSSGEDEEDLEEEDEEEDTTVSSADSACETSSLVCTTATTTTTASRSSADRVRAPPKARARSPPPPPSPAATEGKPRGAVLQRLLSTLGRDNVSLSTLSLLLSILLVVTLSISAVIMSYKILRLQSSLSNGSLPAEEAAHAGHNVYSDMYYMNDVFHTATIRKFHKVLEANIHVLDRVYKSLKTLEQSPLVQAAMGRAAPGPAAPADGCPPGGHT